MGLRVPSLVVLEAQRRKEATNSGYKKRVLPPTAIVAHKH